MRPLSPRSSAIVALVTLALGLSVPGEARAFRTAADLPEFSSAPIGWRQSVVNLDLWDVPTPLASDLRLAAEFAASAWSDPGCSGLQVAVTDDGAPDISVHWIASGWEAAGHREDALAATDVVYSSVEGGTHIVRARIYLNGALIDEGAAGEELLEAVLTHEVGHAIGFLHACEPDDPSVPCADPDFSSALFPSHSASQASLSADDVEGLCSLYPHCADGCAGLDCVFGECVLVCTGEICGAGETCGAVGCVLDCEDGCGCTRSCWGAVGDPCSAGADCATGECSSEGYCTRLCDADTQCLDQWSCADGVCQTDPGKEAFAGACDTGEGCASRLCLVDGQGAGLCTRGCEPECPDGFECALHDDRAVCAPLQGGCSAGGSGPGPATALALVGLALIRRRRR